MPYEFIDEAPKGRYQFIDDAPAEPTVTDKVVNNLKQRAQGYADAFGGAIRGAGSIGATILAPVDAAARAMGIQNDYIGRTDRREAMDAGLTSLIGSDPTSFAYGGGKLATELAGTAGVGGLLAKPFVAAASVLPKAAPMLSDIATGLQTGGFRIGDTVTGTGARAAMRFGTGAATGGASLGLTNPDDAGVGAGIGGFVPLGIAGMGAAGRSVIGTASPEVAALYNKAQQMGISVPADRLTNSRIMNSTANALNYVPFSGREATEQRMIDGLKAAASRTVGQDGANLTTSLSNARGELGKQFDNFLSKTPVNVDNQFLNDLATLSQRAKTELDSSGAGIINGRIDELLSKAQNGVIDSQAAYNIKRSLDAISKQNSPQAYLAGELRGSLMGALNRSLGPDEAAAFAKVRQQYGNMLTLEKLVQNGAEGDISAARLGNLRNVKNSDLKDVVDVAAQFVRPRETAHSGKQTALAGIMSGVGGSVGGPAGMVIGPAVAAGLGRATNALLNSDRLKQQILRPRGLLSDETAYLLGVGTNRTAPLIPGSLLSTD